MNGRDDTRYHRSASPFEREIGFCRALRRGDRIIVSGTAPIGEDGDTAGSDAYQQAQRCFVIIRRAVEALGGRLDDVVRTRMYLVDADDWRAVGRAHGEVFRGIDPAATMVVVGGLLSEDWRVEIEAEAIVGTDPPATDES